MADGNLLSAINSNKYSGLQNLVLFGRVRCAIEKPDFLNSLEASDDGYFALLDAYGVKCLGQDYFGRVDSNKVYYLKGTILIFLNNKKLLGENVKVFGAMKNRGVNVRRQFDCKVPTEGVTAFVFKRANSGFVIVPNTAEVLVQKDASVKGTSLEEYITNIVIDKYAKIDYPETLGSITEFHGVSQYKEIDLDTLNLQEEEYSFINSPDMIDVTKSPIDLEHHFAEDIEVSPLLDAVGEELKNNSNKRYWYARNLIDVCKDLTSEELSEDFDPSKYESKGTYYTTPEIAESIKSLFINNIAKKYFDKVPGSKLKYKAYIDKFLDSLYSTMWKDDEDRSLSLKVIAPCIDSVRERVATQPEILDGYSDTDYENGSSGIPLLREDYKFATLVISVALDIPENHLVMNFNQCKMLYKLGIDVWFCLLIRNPYALGMISSGLSLGDCDRIAFSFGKKYNKGILTSTAKDTRENLMFIEYMDNLNSKDSLIPVSVLSKSMCDYPWKYRQSIMNNGFPAPKDSTVFSESLLEIKLENTVPVSSCKHNPYSKDRCNKLCKNYGVLQDLDTGSNLYYALSSNVEKEYYIYKKLFDKGQRQTGITDELIESTIEAFEEECGFKLEPLQRDGVYLCKYEASVLSGCAGSGKTTASDCMTMLFKEAFPDKSIRYSTPTGKACRRLAEVTGGNVKTLNSRFGIGVYSEPYLCRVGEGRVDPEHCIYIFDEMAMCSMDLLYNTVKNISPTEDMVYFLGDIKQLPPIGKGNPFKLLMSFLPCVELGVSKRAAEGSLVNYNTTLVNNFSEGFMYELKYDNKTFIKLECSDVEIAPEVTKAFLGFRNGTLNGTKYTEDDIQVITGYQKEDCLFSAPVLNLPLHTTLRSNDRVLYTYNGKEFCLNERVMHMKRNSYEMPRYRKTGNGIYEGIITFGSVNGEMGKITGFVRSDMIQTTPFDYGGFSSGLSKDDPKYQEKSDLLDAYLERLETIVDNSIFNDEDTYFVEVCVYDVSLREDVYLLYRANRKESPLTGVYFEGGDLENLEYAYALTTHKMQGSQSPVVICAFGSTSNADFINRNMINTMFTRSQGVVAVVGSVTGEDSPINRGRRKQSTVYCKDMLSLLSGVEIK